MKEPKSFKYPRLYWRHTTHREDPHGSLQRLRIIYPDGSADWDCVCFEMSHWMSSPCWLTSEDPFENVEAMKAYDSIQGFQTIFLGEIK